MEKKHSVKCEIFSWRTEDFAEYCKLPEVLHDGITDKIASISSDGVIDVYEIQTQCENCYQSFHPTAFDKHICGYSDRKTFVFDEQMMNFLWEESSLRKMYTENNKVIQQILDQNGDVNNRSKDAKRSVVQAHHVCTVCHRMYVHASGLSRHMETQHNSTDTRFNAVDQSQSYDETSTEVIKCLVCGQVFYNLTACFMHLKSTHTEFGFDESERSLEAGDSLLFEKIKLEHAFQCEFCDLLFADTSGLFQHKMTHDISTGYECSSCELASRNLKFILNHRVSECPYEMYEKNPKINCQLRFVCSDCEATYPSLAQLYEHRHLKSHFQTLYSRTSEQNEYFCEKCGQIFEKDVNALMVHIDAIHSKKGKTQSLPMTTTVRPYLCEVCGKGYTQSSHLYQHLRFHKGIKPFECTKDGCNRRFTIRPDLNDHIRKCHTGERPYKCSDCHKTFLTGSVYYQHRLIHRNERRYGCRTCEKRFHRSDALKNHERIHSGEKPYACGVCAKTFRQKGDRDKHFRSRHQNGLLGLNGTREDSPSDFLMGLAQMRPYFKKINGIDILSIAKE
ncbi:testis-specific zinc finger protein topi-like isoform X2 [Sitodiplosis mosellana]|uniref:testis-specific zinc finger protein topi-like isoform X2 n=1 Tax=Sitodiplosis mosellana TaxID=263140 RepID=UPI002444A51F|nr:testis-specific zinc finger protein topi-like isoform X2 [Sitodiplosis mosellana]